MHSSKVRVYLKNNFSVFLGEMGKNEHFVLIMHQNSEYLDKLIIYPNGVLCYDWDTSLYRIKNGNTSILGTISMAYANMVHSNSPTVGIV